nr:MAG TPA: hypothetical protein [Caudoviricetes sp.]
MIYKPFITSICFRYRLKIFLKLRFYSKPQPKLWI